MGAIDILTPTAQDDRRSTKSKLRLILAIYQNKTLTQR